MTELYKPEAFAPHTGTPWNEARVADGIQAIVEAAESVFDEQKLWPSGEWERWQTPLGLKSLYVGAAGIVWALHVLRSRSRDLARAIAHTHEVWTSKPDLCPRTPRRR